MPEDGVSDLQDVFDAINKLCETMRTSHEDVFEDCPQDITDSNETVNDSTDVDVASPEQVEVQTVDHQYSELVSPEEVVVRTVDSYTAERWSDAVSPPQDDVETIPSDTEPMMAPVSEMYYTASSEVSLLSDMEPADKPSNGEEAKETDEKGECVIAGHVAAMRERFESMTRTNTPCPDLMRSTSPNLELFRNITPSPDLLDK